MSKLIRDKNNHCSWCGKSTWMNRMLLPETPILEFMEEKINAYGRDLIPGAHRGYLRESMTEM